MKDSVARLMLVLFVVLLITGPHHGVLAQDDAEDDTSSSRTVNLEIIVDSSGSMADVTDTGELRMDSAKQVLNEVVTAIPDTEGVNVGLRVYGHEGDNTEARMAESCASSDLLVPMDGVAQEELTEEINALQPTGWTPLGYALEQAGDDFEQPASDDVQNAVILVTDGIETCGGDPVAVAEELQAADIALTTNVIGFATTPEDQALLEDIAEAGNGELFEAPNAGQLISAIFQVLEELEVVDAGGTGESRESPLGIGRTGMVGDYEVTVISVTPNALDEVMAENQFNEPPADGNQFFLARIAVTYTGSETGTPSAELGIQAVGDLNSSYTTFNNRCGVIPDDALTVNELFEGGSAEFNVCWEIDSDDADSLVMYVGPVFSLDAEPVWFSLGNQVTTPEPADEPDARLAEDEEEDSDAAADDDGEVVTDSSRENPIPVGNVGIVGDYEIRVVEVTPDATELVLAENEFNEPPEDGNQFFLTRVQVTYVGSETGLPYGELDFQAVGDLNSGYTTYNNMCGVIPDEGAAVVNELFEGASAEFNVCWQIDSEDADSLVMYVDSFLSFDSEPVWFSLEP